MVSVVKRYAKALVLLALIILAAIAEVLGLDLGLNIEHYISLLVANVLVYAVPNTDDTERVE